ncbi:MAG: hypothetical protein EOO11_06945 [Chitinophagaceae bacterium]|nr:MAG: hypothetical protein EOO11_06945 [Chitinophagaceae bacterium]
MRPSDKVWQGISANLKRRNRRIGWIASLLLLLTSASGYFLSQQQSGQAGRADLAQHPGSKTASRRAGAAFNEAAGNQGPAGAATAPTDGAQPASTGENASATSNTNNIPTGAPAELQPLTASGPDGSTGVLRVATRNSSGATRSGSRGRNELRLVHSAYGTPAATMAPRTETVSAPTAFDPAAADHFRTNAALEQPAGLRVDLSSAPATDVAAADPLKLKKPSKMSVQFFFTPTISYRKLSENKDFTSTTPQSSASPNYAALYNINDAVTHKPNIGLELGLTAKYPVARNLKLQGGLQFNMSRYDVQAFDNWVNEGATMALRDGSNSISSTPYSNFNGGHRNWLQNLYFQVSVPLGIEMKLAGNDKTQFGIASTVQPTYILGDRVYMLSTDYKNYAEVPWLMRRLNVNTALSTYVSYSTGKVNWQMGPQIRYQLLSSFVGKYPVKENLFDFGLRVGVTFKGAARTKN